MPRCFLLEDSKGVPMQIFLILVWSIQWPNPLIRINRQYIYSNIILCFDILCNKIVVAEQGLISSFADISFAFLCFFEQHNAAFVVNSIPGKYSCCCPVLLSLWIRKWNQKRKEYLWGAETCSEMFLSGLTIFECLTGFCSILKSRGSGYNKTVSLKQEWLHENILRNHPHLPQPYLSSLGLDWRHTYNCKAEGTNKF